MFTYSPAFYRLLLLNACVHATLATVVALKFPPNSQSMPMSLVIGCCIAFGSLFLLDAVFGSMGPPNLWWWCFFSAMVVTIGAPPWCVAAYALLGRRVWPKTKRFQFGLGQLVWAVIWVNLVCLAWYLHSTV
jgi:hypothetical protein